MDGKPEFKREIPPRTAAWPSGDLSSTPRAKGRLMMPPKSTPRTAGPTAAPRTEPWKPLDTATVPLCWGLAVMEGRGRSRSVWGVRVGGPYAWPTHAPSCVYLACISCMETPHRLAVEPASFVARCWSHRRSNNPVATAHAVTCRHANCVSVRPSAGHGLSAQLASADACCRRQGGPCRSPSLSHPLFVLAHNGCRHCAASGTRSGPIMGAQTR